MPERMECMNSEPDWQTLNTQEHAELFSAVFGDSDVEEDFSDNDCIKDEADFEPVEVQLWEEVVEVEGLWHCSHFLSLKQQYSLLKAIDSGSGLLTVIPVTPSVLCCSAGLSQDQAMRFGDLPGWAMDLSALIQTSIGGPRGDENLEEVNCEQHSKTDGLHELGSSISLSLAQILQREPLFDQMIVNLYQPGEGISAHVDLLRFEDGIAIVSLESPCVMSFRLSTNASDGVGDICSKEPILNPHHASTLGHDAADYDFGSVIKHSRPLSCKQLEASGIIAQAKEHKSRSHIRQRDPYSGVAKQVDVLLNPGDLIITYGPARYNWTHEIARDKNDQVWEGKPIVQQRRISVTLRRLCFQQDVH